MLKDIKSGIIISIIFLAILGIVGVSYSALNSLKATTNETLSVAKWDSLVDHAVPSGAINAFYLPSCPDNWKAADGTNGTPDLRGQFLRGLNDFGSLAGPRTDGNENPENKGLGDYQADELASHRHSMNIQSNYGYPTGGGGVRAGGTSYTSYTGGDETRPKNVSVIFCIKE